MLYISVRNKPVEKYVTNVDSFFDLSFKKDWLNNDFIKDLILVIDKTKVVGNYALESPVLGTIAPSLLSTGCKCLISTYYRPEPYIFKGSCMGDNCFPWLFKIAEDRDVKIHLGYCPNLPLDCKMQAIFTDTGKFVHTEEEFTDEFYNIKC